MKRIWSLAAMFALGSSVSAGRAEMKQSILRIVVVDESAQHISHARLSANLITLASISNAN